MKNLLTTLTVLLVAATTVAQVPSYVPTNGLVGYWPFNGNANDESGNGNNGTVNGATLTTDRFGNANSAYSFDGVNDYIDLGSYILNQPQEYTIDLWAKFNNPTYSYLFGQATNGEIQINLDGSGNVNSWNKLTNGGSVALGTQIPDFSNWHHITAVFNNNTKILQFILDGVTFSTTIPQGVNIANFLGPAIFGRQSNVNANFFNGQLDDIGIWNRALTQQEITNLYTSSLPQPTCSISASASAVCAGTPVTLTASSSAVASFQDSILVDQFTMTVNNYYSHYTPALQVGRVYRLIVNGRYGFYNGWPHNDPAWNHSGPSASCVNQGVYDIRWLYNGATNFQAPDNNFNNAQFCNGINQTYYWTINGNSQAAHIEWLDGAYGDNSGSLSFSIYEMTNPTTTSYLWSNGATTPSITVIPTQTTTYTLTVTENGQTCTASSTVNVSTPTATISANGPTSFCTGGSVTLTANSGSSYLWSNGATSQSITVTQGGNYSVTVTNNGCSATSGVTTVTVNPTPTAGVTVGGATTFCTGGSVTLTAQGTGSYLWSNGATSQSITVTQGGNYSVTVTNNGCSATSGVTTVTVNPTPTASIAPQGNTTFCQGGFVVLQAAGGGTYQWNTGAQTANISVSQSGTYVVQVSQNGCTASAQQQVTVNPLPSVSLQPIAALCANASAVALTGGSPAGGSFTVNGTPATTLNPAQTGSGQQTVAYTFTNGNGCSNTATQSATVNATPAVSMSGLNTNYTLTDPFSTLTGTPTGGVFNGAGMVANYFDPSVAGLGTHGIAYIYVDGNGCIGSDAQCTTVDLNINIGGSNIGVDEGSIDVYPNPSNGNFAVAIEGIEGIIGLSVFDARGREVLVTSLVGNGQKTIQNIDLSNYANGVYTISIRTAKGTASQKLVKE